MREEAGFLGYVAELAGAFVVIEDAVSVVGDEEVAQAVVIVVGGADALAPSGSGQAGSCGDVFKLEIAEIAVEVAGGRVGGWIEGSGVHQKDIRAAVVVVIEDRDARAGGFEEILLDVAAAGDVDRGEACFFGDVAEVDGDGRQICLDRLHRAAGSLRDGHPLEG